MDKKPIIFLLGAAGSGKSTYRKKFLKNFKYVDIFDFQNDIDHSIKIYNQALKQGFSFPRAEKSDLEIPEAACIYTLIEVANKTSGTVVLEHLLSNSSRRKEYIEIIKKYTGRPIECILVKPLISQVKKNIKKRVSNWEKEGKIFEGETKEFLEEKLLSQYKYWQKIADKPLKSDGFESVVIVKEFRDA